jgi:hypothetical protein
MNNSKLILFLSCLAALTLTASVVTAAPRGGGHRGGHHFASMPARGGQTFTRSGMGTWSGQRWGGRNWNGGNWSGQRWGGGNWNRNWNHHHNNNNDVIFIGSFGFPWWWGWGWGYPYGYYGYGSGYPYGYGYGYGDPYGYDYNSYYGSSYGGASDGYGSPTHSRVAELQRRLARAGYYDGAIDGILGPRTRQAIRAYERDHGYSMIDRRLLTTAGLG